jgi:hypothetical protein
MTKQDPNKIQERNDELRMRDQMQYLLGVADSVGYVIISSELMQKIAYSYSWIDRQNDSYRADEKRRIELEKKRKSKAREST